MSKSKNRGDIIEAQFVMLEDNEPRRKKSFAPVLATGMIVGILFLFMFGIVIGHQADQMPQTEEEVLIQQYEEALVAEEEPIPPQELLSLHPSQEEQKRKRVQEVLEKLDQVWSTH